MGFEGLGDDTNVMMKGTTLGIAKQINGEKNKLDQHFYINPAAPILCE